MSKNILKNQIISLLEEIVEQSQTINAYEGQIPQIELDIVMANIRELYSAYHKLTKINNSYTTVQEPTNEAPKEENPQVLAAEKPKEASKEEKAEPVDMPSPKTEEKKEVIAEEKKKEEAVVEPPKEETAPKAEISKENEATQPSLGLFAEEKTIGDKFMEENEKSSVNEKIQLEKTDYSIGKRMQESAITDLRSAIGLNEKFLFINGLFKGNHDAYHTTVDEINSVENKEKAFDLLENKAAKYAWDNNTEIKKKFYHLVERRFE